LNIRDIHAMAVAARAAGRLISATAKGQSVRAPASEIARRLEICKACEFFQGAPMKCLKCRCFLNFKVRLETEHCPISKW
jgi:Family of unknown function (DUF6171)